LALRPSLSGGLPFSSNRTQKKHQLLCVTAKSMPSEKMTVRSVERSRVVFGLSPDIIKEKLFFNRFDQIGANSGRKREMAVV
jgi:hypothetical protein